MSGALTITPAMRFAELQRSFKAMVGSRRKKLSAIQAYHVSKAASLQQVIELSVLERALGAAHDRSFIEQLKQEVHRHLTAAGVKQERKEGNDHQARRISEANS